MSTKTNQAWYESVSTVAFGLSLTAFMAAALFVLVAINPKAESYGNLPWYYAAGNLVASGLLYWLSQRTAPVKHEEPLGTSSLSR